MVLILLHFLQSYNSSISTFLLDLYFQFTGANTIIITAFSYMYSIVFGTRVILSTTETFSHLRLCYVELTYTVSAQLCPE